MKMAMTFVSSDLRAARFLMRVSVSLIWSLLVSLLLTLLSSSSSSTLVVWIVSGALRRRILRVLGFVEEDLVGVLGVGGVEGEGGYVSVKTMSWS